VVPIMVLYVGLILGSAVVIVDLAIAMKRYLREMDRRGVRVDERGIEWPNWSGTSIAIEWAELEGMSAVRCAGVLRPPVVTLEAEGESYTLPSGVEGWESLLSVIAERADLQLCSENWFARRFRKESEDGLGV